MNKYAHIGPNGEWNDDAHIGPDGKWIISERGEKGITGSYLLPTPVFPAPPDTAGLGGMGVADISALLKQIEHIVPPRIKETGKYRWKSNARPPDIQSNEQIPLVSEEVNLGDGELLNEVYGGLNILLGHCGYSEGGERNALLRRLSEGNGNSVDQYFPGVDVLRQTFPLALGHGLIGNNLRTSQERKGIFGPMAVLVKERGVSETDYLIRGFDLNNLSRVSQLEKQYALANIGGEIRPVPREDLGILTLKLGSIPLRSKAGPGLLEGLGYTLQNVDGVMAYSR